MNWDQQQSAVGIGQGAVHLALGIGENPVAEQTFQHALRLRLAVLRFDRDQGEQARPDAAHGFSGYVHLGAQHALDQGNHAVPGSCGAGADHTGSGCG